MVKVIRLEQEEEISVFIVGDARYQSIRDTPFEIEDEHRNYFSDATRFKIIGDVSQGTPVNVVETPVVTTETETKPVVDTPVVTTETETKPVETPVTDTETKPVEATETEKKEEEKPAVDDVPTGV